MWVKPTFSHSVRDCSYISWSPEKRGQDNNCQKNVSFFLKENSYTCIWKPVWRNLSIGPKRSPGAYFYSKMYILAMPSTYVGVLTSRCYSRAVFYTASRLELIYETKCGGRIAIISLENGINRLPVFIMSFAIGPSCWDNRGIFFRKSENDFLLFIHFSDI